MSHHNRSTSVKDIARLQNNQSTKELQSNLNNKTRLDYKVLQDTKYSNLKCNKYNKVKSIVETTYNVKNEDNVDWINLDYQDELNQHCITNFGCNVSYAQ
jgi:hypothetical protein